MIKEGYCVSDLPALHHINESSFVEEERPSRTEFYSMITTSDVFITSLDSPVGFAIVHTLGASPYLWHFAVAPRQRGQGLGRELLNYIRDYYRAKDCKEIRLHVRPDNPAQKLYFDVGYRVYRIAKDHYASGKDALMMKQKLDYAAVSQADGYSE